jgi:pyridoxamine 5'-phosphate oxidase
VDEGELLRDPLAQVAAWLDEARQAGVEAAEAMALATATREGAPSVRMVLLKRCDRRGLGFFTNTESRKALELDGNPRAAVALHWQALARQVRAEGEIERLPEADARAYFDTRPRGSRLAAWASPQSRPLPDRSALDDLYAEAERRFAGVEDPPLPPHWGGYLLVPSTVELWQSRPNRMHDRIRYTRRGAAWRLDRLAP